MEINLTLIGQLITFAIVVWFTMRYVWPPLTKTLAARQKHISEGLIAAEEALRDRERAKSEVLATLNQAKIEAAQIMEQAHKRANALIEQAKVTAYQEGQQLIATAKIEISRDIIAAKEQLQAQLAQLVVAGAEKVLKREINSAANQSIIDEIVKTKL